MQVSMRDSEKTLIEWLRTTNNTDLDRAAYPAQWFQQPTVQVAQCLLGTLLVHRYNNTILVARIVETEAYLSHDPASHSWRGKTHRNRAMFAIGGCLYVYRIYGVHRCINIVTEAEDVGAAVLIRAAEPVLGIDTMRALRGNKIPEVRLLSGPANLAKGMGFDLDDNFRPCYTNGVWILPDPQSAHRIGISPRIGVTLACDELLRFFCIDSPAVSVHRRARRIIQ